MPIWELKFASEKLVQIQGALGSEHVVQYGVVSGTRIEQFASNYDLP